MINDEVHKYIKKHGIDFSTSVHVNGGYQFVSFNYEAATWGSKPGLAIGMQPTQLFIFPYGLVDKQVPG